MTQEAGKVQVHVSKSRSRRQVLQLAVVGTGAVLVAELVSARQVIKEIHELRPGEFTWHPERSPSGPVAVVVSLPDQRVHVYRNGVRIAVSTCSTGKAGHGTPTGVFTILQKDRHHHSSTYNNAPMPNMNRLTWSGIALHAGKLPGYPASHGCVRLPFEFSQLLFSITHIGTPVIVANDHSAPMRVAHPGMVLDADAKRKMDSAASKLKPQPGQHHDENPTPPLSILISGADRTILLLENGTIVAQGEATIKNPQQPLGSHVFILSQAADAHTYWHGIGHHGDARAESAELATLQRVGCSDSMSAAIHQKLHPGATITMTDYSLTPETRSRKDFVIVTTETS
jgi:hypothetical protein